MVIVIKFLPCVGRISSFPITPMTWIGVIGKDDIRPTHGRNLITITMACTATFVSMQTKPELYNTLLTEHCIETNVAVQAMVIVIKFLPCVGRNLITITMACTATFVSMQCSVSNVL
jgi:DNA-binding protein YbaB